MRLSRIYSDQALQPGSNVELDGDGAGYVARVLRLEPGDELTLFNGRGGEYRTRLVSAKKNRVTCVVQSFAAVEREASMRIHLLQGVARSDRMDAIVQKATELGIARLTPVMTIRSVAKVRAEASDRKHAHWRGIAVAACEQSGRNRVPEIDPPMTVEQACHAPLQAVAKILLDPLAGRSLVEFCSNQPAVDGFALLIGPEGGLAEEERSLAGQAGFQRCSLGPRILRTETASLAALAVLHAIAGDFRGHAT